MDMDVDVDETKLYDITSWAGEPNSPPKLWR